MILEDGFQYGRVFIASEAGAAPVVDSDSQVVPGLLVLIYCIYQLMYNRVENDRGEKFISKS
jgi:hypothetical protein